MLDAAVKARIDAMPYEELLQKWRYSPLDDPMFLGATGAYCVKLLGNMRRFL